MSTKNHPAVKFVFFFFFFLLLPLIVSSQTDDRLSNDWFQTKMDSIIEANQAEYLVPGVTYAIVKGKQIAALNGMGLADLDTNRPMDPVQTRFMLGSLSKLIVATAVMQMVEAGQVDLDRDVNEYLSDIKVPAVSLRQLLTHTAGFEERTFARLRLKAKNFLPLKTYLEQRMPEQIFPVAKVGAYSNHGVALAGLIVQEMSGQPFEQYTEEKIFSPLGMKNTSFSIDPLMDKDLATPYLVREGQLVPTHYEYVQTAPASMMIGTAMDMARFMISQLNGGVYIDEQILSRESVDTLQKQHFSASPNMDGRALGFFEYTYRGRRALTHGNTRNGFVSYLFLIPEDSLGIFVTMNGGSGSFRTKVIDELLDQIYPQVREHPEFIKPEGGLGKYTGTYLSARRNETTIERIFHQVFLGNEVKVEALADTALFLFNQVYKMERSGNFSNPEGSFRIVFEELEDGQMVLHLPGRSDALVRLPWYGQKGFTALALGVTLFTFLLILLGRGLKSLFKKKNGRFLMDNSWIWLSVSGILFFALFIGSVLQIREGMQYGVPVFFYLIFGLPFLSILFYLLGGFRSFSKWQEMGKTQKILHLFLLVVGAIFLWELYYWNLIGFYF